MIEEMVCTGNSDIQKRISYSDIVPTEIQDELIQIGLVDTQNMFYIGDIANDLYETAVALRKPITHQYVCAAVAKFCGRSSRTVRLYSNIADFYSLVTRTEYDMLSFSHFVAARQYGEDWREVLEVALSGEYSPLSVDETHAKFLNLKGVTQATDKFREIDIVPRLEDIIEHNILPQFPDDDFTENELFAVTKILRNLIDRIISKDRKERAIKALDELLSAITG